MARRAGRAYQAFKALVRHTHAIRADPCALCTQPIDYTLAYPHPNSWSLDHVQALHQGGQEFDPTNTQASHLHCNLSRGATEGNQRRTPRAWTSRRW